MMEFDEVTVKDSPGLCRCCLSEGCYKDLSTVYPWMNESEIYADMLFECFDISISQHMDGPNGHNRLICEVCITRLRDACNFKKQVLDSEKKFIEMLAKGDFSRKVVVYQDDLKAELQEMVPDSDAANAKYLEDDVDYCNDDLMNPDEPTTSVSEGVTAAPLTVKAKRGRPRKKPEDKVEKKIKTKTEQKLKKSRATVKGEPRGGRKTSEDAKDAATVSSDDETLTELSQKLSGAKNILSARDKRKIMRENVIQVLTKSTVMAFRWLKSCYRCFYCYDIFQEASDLKSHQAAHTNDDCKQQAMTKFWDPFVYVDVSNISCKLCPEPVTDLYELIDHLIAKHDVVYNKDVGICMVAFKLDNLNVSCLACGASFYTFGPLLHHTNKDHKGTSAILCDVCGQHFKDDGLLRVHVKAVHENSGLLCPECGERFETRYKLRTHQQNQHDMERKFKCLVCTLTFQSHYKRSRHMAEEHNNRRQIKCLHCPKTFVFRSMMMSHVRDTHLKVRNQICSVCGWKTFHSYRLKNHMYKHSGEKNFKCDVCDKAFTTKKIMRAHFARMHKPVYPTAEYDNQCMGQ